MGFFDSKSESASAPGTSGAQTQQGEATAINLSAGGDIGRGTSVTVNSSTSDYGAIEGALSLAGGAFSKAIDFGGDIYDKSLDFAELSLKEAHGAYAESNQISRRAIDEIVGAVESSQQFTRQAFDNATDAFKFNAQSAEERSFGSLTKGLFWLGLAALAVIGLRGS